jgi:hypothetical protein
MELETFETRYCKALGLLRQGRMRLAMVEIDNLLKAIGSRPKSKSERVWRSMCRNEKASLLYHLGRLDDMGQLMNEIAKERRRFRKRKAATN